MDHHHHHRPTTRRQALGEINGNVRGGNNNSKDAVKKGYVRKNFCVSSSKRVKKRCFYSKSSLSRERWDDVFFFYSFPFSFLRGKEVPRFSKVRTTYALCILLSPCKLLRFIKLKTKQRGSATRRVHPNQIWSHAESADSKFL